MCVYIHTHVYVTPVIENEMEGKVEQKRNGNL